MRVYVYPSRDSPYARSSRNFLNRFKNTLLKSFNDGEDEKLEETEQPLGMRYRLGCGLR